MKHFPFRPSNTLILIAILLVVFGCSVEDDEFHTPQNKSELREFVKMLARYSDAEIQKKNAENVRDTVRESLDGSEVTTFSIQVGITEDGLGLDWKRGIYQDTTPEQNTALKSLMDGPDSKDLETYCPPRVLDLMKNLGYHQRVRLYVRDGELISDYDMDYSACLKLRNFVEKYERVNDHQNETELSGVGIEETEEPVTLEQAREQMNLLVLFIKKLQVENDDTCSIKNGLLCFEPVDAELAENEFLVTLTNRVTESLGTEELKSISSLLRGGFDAQKNCRDRWLMMMKDFGLVVRVRWLSFENELFSESFLGEAECELALAKNLQ